MDFYVFIGILSHRERNSVGDGWGLFLCADRWNHNMAMNTVQSLEYYPKID